VTTSAAPQPPGDLQGAAWPHLVLLHQVGAGVRLYLHHLQRVAKVLPRNQAVAAGSDKRWQAGHREVGDSKVLPRNQILAASSEGGAWQDAGQ